MTKISGIRIVCMDIDWTLIGHSPTQEDDLLRTLGFEVSSEFKNQVEVFWSKLPKKLQNGKKVEKAKIYSLAEEMIPYLSKINLTGEKWYELQHEVDEPVLIDGAYELLQYLQNQGYYLVASTNGFAFDQSKILKKLNILDFFDRIYGWDTICAKPHRKALLSLQSIHDSDAMIFIGDSVYTDINFANKIGIKSIGYNLQYSEREEYIKPTVHVSNLKDIKKYL